MNHSDVIPDLLVFAKGIGSGMPISGVATRSELTAHQVNVLPETVYICAAAIAGVVLYPGVFLGKLLAMRIQIYDCWCFYCGLNGGGDIYVQLVDCNVVG